MLRGFTIDRVLGRWAAATGDPGRVHLVTLPPSGGDRSLLWSRFVSVCGVDPTWAPHEARRVNDSIGLPEAQFLRELNGRLGDAARRGGPLHAAVRDVVSRALAPRDSDRVRLDPRHEPWVVALTERWVAWVRESGIDVVGDLADLEIERLDPAHWCDPDVVHPESLAAADAALVAVRRARGRAARR